MPGQSTFEIDMGEIDLSVGGYSQEFHAYCLKNGAFHALWTGATATDGTLRLEESVNKDVWFPATTTVTITNACGARLWKFPSLECGWYRVYVTPGTNTAGTVYCAGIGKP